MSIIETHKLKKVYNHNKLPVEAIQHVDLAVNEGEFTAIVGPSGCGKTTLLNLIGGLDKPTEGMIKVADVEIAKLSEAQLTDFRLKNIGFVFQSYNLIPVLTAKENVEFVMLLQNTSKAIRDRRAEGLLERMGIADVINRKPSELSGGQQQRVAVARALASKPRFILADEPTANLDSHATESLLDIMAEMNKEENATFVFSTHDQRVIDKARRVIRLEDGLIKSDEKRP